MFIEILAVIGLDYASTIVLDNLRTAADILRKKYGIKTIIIPHNTWSDSVNSSIKSLPAIIIGGKKVILGDVPSVEEIIRYVLDYVNQVEENMNNEILLPAGIVEKDSTFFSAATI